MHTPEQLNTALAGRYAIDRQIGEGGMATVYLARDVRHNRRVAVKVLRPDLGAIVGVERFLSEIEVTANLQHPNLLPLFDSGEAGGLLFYVMPYVEGESLRARLTREKQLPVDEVVRLATAVAGALDYAHRHGVIHRDLKPENILLHDGQPLVADFGIALAVSNAGGNRITQTGLSLGTPQYMSPEQATGDRTIDGRTDVYSLGALTYEMLTGEPPHTGSTSQAIIARILTERPRDIHVSRPNVPAHVGAAVEHALEKLPADRWATAKEFGEALTGARPVTVAATHATASHASATGGIASRRARRRELVAWGVMALSVVGLAFFALQQAPEPVAGVFEVSLPDSVSSLVGNTGHTVAISRDGAQVAILGARGGTRMIYLRRLDDPAAQPVRGTEGALFHSFSPDGRSLLFMVTGTLKTVSVEGGSAQTVADGTALFASSWSDDGTILYTRAGESLWRSSSDGGDRRLLVAYDSARGLSVVQPSFLPGGSHALATRLNRTYPDSTALVVVDVSNGSVTELGVLGAGPRYSGTGHIVFVRPGGIVLAAPFSPLRRAITGTPVQLLEGIRSNPTPLPTAALAVSDNGTIVYESGAVGSVQTMYVVGRDGSARALKGPQQMYREPRVSPDGRRIVVRIAPGPIDGGLWIHDIVTGQNSRLTADSGSFRGEWSRDGRNVIYVDLAMPGFERVLERPWDLSGPPVELARGDVRDFHSVSVGPRGGYMAVRRGDRQRDIFLARTDSLGAARPFVATPAEETDPRLSPDGRLLAYTSNETGKYEVFVAPVPGPGPRTQVSIDGGTEAVWAPDGRTLYYRGPVRMMAATIATKPVLAVAQRDTLFVDTYRRYELHAAYDVMPNGREFLMTAGLSTRASVFAIVNWPQLRRVRGAAGER